MEMKHLFSFVPEARKGDEVTGVSLSSDAGCGCIGRWLRSHRTRLVANPRCCAVGRLHRRVRRFCIGRWLNTVQRPVPGDMARGRRTGEHRMRWCVRWWCAGRVRCAQNVSGCLLECIGRARVRWCCVVRLVLVYWGRWLA
jgi:hypothetical protein